MSAILAFFDRRVRGLLVWFAHTRDWLGDPAVSRGRRLERWLTLAARGIGLALVALFAYALLLLPFTPGISDLRAAKVDRPAIVLSSDGKELTRFMRFNREWRKISDISPHVIAALIATEDHRFYTHNGIDFRRTASSVLHTLSGNPQGGSTLTQQLARNLYPREIGRAPSVTRKLKEMITALKLEYAYSKEEILETYLNTVPFLYNAYGIDMASRTYFGKRAADLDLLESATLVGMLKGTSYYNPVRSPERSLQRRNVVLSQMVKRGKLSVRQYETLKERPINVSLRRQPPIKSLAPHFTEQVRRWLIQWADEHDFSIYADGLVIHTTLYYPMQQMAQQAVARQTAALQAIADVEWGMASSSLLSTDASSYRYLRNRVDPFGYYWRSRPDVLEAMIRESAEYRALIERRVPEPDALAALRADRAFVSRLKAAKTRLEAGFVAIDPANGQVKAWVGGRDFKRDGYDHVIDARRQPGSTFKPFVYAAALKSGFKPDDKLPDRLIEFRLKGNEIWRPQDRVPPSGQLISLRDALAYSKNTITAQLIAKVGAARVADLAHELGVNRSELEEVPSLALGTSPVSLLEMVSAYATLANGGLHREPVWVTRITDREGNVVAEFSAKSNDALDEKTSIELVDMMRGVVNRGTGRGIRQTFGVYADVAGKTGTTQNNADGWFILMHPTLVGGAWVGFNDGRIAFRSNYWGQGAHNALYVVGDFYRQLLRRFRKLDSDYQPPKPRPGSLGRWVDRIERLIYGTQVGAGKFGRRSDASGGFDLPVLEDVVMLAARIESWFAPESKAPTGERRKQEREHREQERESESQSEPESESPWPILPEGLPPESAPVITIDPAPVEPPPTPPSEEELPPATQVEIF